MEEKETFQQDEVLAEDFDLFGDEDTNQPEAVAEEPAQELEDQQQEPAAEQQPEEVEDKEESFTIDFLGKKQTLTKQQMIEAAQKGMNYDHVKEKADKADKYEAAHKAVERLAQAAGMEVDAYIQNVENEISGREVKELTDQGMDEALAKELITLRKEKAASAAAQEDAAKQEQMVKAWDEFAAYFGGWDKAPFKPQNGVDEFPKPMLENISKGDSPLTAYLKWAVKENEVKTAVKTATEENIEKSPGSAKGQAPTATKSAFLSGLFGED